MTVGIQSDEGLENRGSQLEDQRNQTNLRKRKTVQILQQGVQCRNNRLNHVIQQMASPHGEQYRISRTLRKARMPFYLIPYIHIHILSPLTHIWCLLPAARTTVQADSPQFGGTKVYRFQQKTNNKKRKRGCLSMQEGSFPHHETTSIMPLRRSTSVMP